MMNRLVRPLVSVATCAAAWAFVKNTPTVSYCDMEKSSANITPVIPAKAASTTLAASPSNSSGGAKEEEEEDDEEFELTPEKEDCPFCQHFLKSPCAKQFIKWSKCVDKCKADDTDFVTVCEDYTTKLLVCTEKNVEYFKSTMPGDDDSSAEGSSNTDSEAKPAVESIPVEERPQSKL